jgi:hypothetical protein
MITHLYIVSFNEVLFDNYLRYIMVGCARTFCKVLAHPPSFVTDQAVTFGYLAMGVPHFFALGIVQGKGKW